MSFMDKKFKRSEKEGANVNTIILRILSLTFRSIFPDPIPIPAVYEFNFILCLQAGYNALTYIYNIYFSCKHTCCQTIIITWNIIFYNQYLLFKSDKKIENNDEIASKRSLLLERILGQLTELEDIAKVRTQLY